MYIYMSVLPFGSMWIPLGVPILKAAQEAQEGPGAARRPRTGPGGPGGPRSGQEAQEGPGAAGGPRRPRRAQERPRRGPVFKKFKIFKKFSND